MGYQKKSFAIAPFQPGHEIGPARGKLHNFRLYSLSFETHRRDLSNPPLVSRRIGCIGSHHLFEGNPKFLNRLIVLIDWLGVNQRHSHEKRND